MENLEKEIEILKERNRRVERDKAWETSFARRAILVTMTYFSYRRGFVRPEGVGPCRRVCFVHFDTAFFEKTLGKGGKITRQYFLLICYCNFPDYVVEIAKTKYGDRASKAYLF